MNIEESINLLEWANLNKLYIETYYECDYHNIYKAIETLLTAYEKEKEKNSKAIGHIEACKTSLGNYILSPNETEYLLSILKEE